MPSITHNTPDTQLRQLGAASSSAPAPAESSTPAATPIAAHQAPLSRSQSLRIEAASNPPSRPASRTGSRPASLQGQPVPTASGSHSDPLQALVEQRTLVLEKMAAGDPPLPLLREQFRLEGEALRVVLGNDQDKIADLMFGIMTRKALKGQLPDDQQNLRSDAYAKLNQGLETPVPQPYGADFLRAHHIGDDNTHATEQLCLTHEAFDRVLNQMNSDGASKYDIFNVRMAHEAFKIEVASRERELELNLIGEIYNKDKVDIRVPLFKNDQKRAAMNQALQPDPDTAAAELTAFYKASNYVLNNEHIADIVDRAITREDSLKSAAAKVGKEAAVLGAAQLIISLLTWGYSRGGGAAAADLLPESVAGSARDATSVLLQGFAVGASHTLMSGGPKDLMQGAAEKLLHVHPPEATKPEQVFPDTRRSGLDEHGNPVAIPQEQVDRIQGDIAKYRKDFKQKNPRFAFGNVTADNIGEGSFAGSNMVRGAGVATGHPEADSIHAKSGTSGVGGLVMATTQATGQISQKSSGVPTHAMAKHDNPRGVGERALEGMQKLDMTKVANRKEAEGKMVNASMGIGLAEVTHNVASLPIAAAQEASKNRHMQRFLGIVYDGLEGAKSGMTLVPFFGGLSIPTDMKTIAGDMGDGARRSLAAAHNLFNPGRRGSTDAYDEGTFDYVRQEVNNVAKGASQIVAQPTVNLMDKAVKTTGKVIGGGVDLLRSKPEGAGGDGAGGGTTGGTDASRQA